MKIVKLKDTVVNRQKIKVLEYLKKNPTASYIDISSALNIAEHKVNIYIDSLVYHELIIITREFSGVFSSSLKEVVGSIELILATKTCSSCSKEFKKKKTKAKHQNLCLECTTAFFMSRKISDCFYCGISMEKRGSYSLGDGLISHKECRKLHKHNSKII